MGCEIGNHTWNHPVLTKLTDKEVEEQINKTNEAIKVHAEHIRQYSGRVTALPMKM